MMKRLALLRCIAHVQVDFLKTGKVMKVHAVCGSESSAYCNALGLATTFLLLVSIGLS